MAKGVIFSAEAAKAILAMELRDRKSRLNPQPAVGPRPSTMPTSLRDQPYYDDATFPFSFLIDSDTGIMTFYTGEAYDSFGEKIEIKLPARLQLYPGTNLVYLKYWVVPSSGDATTGHVWRFHCSTYDILKIEPQAIPVCFVHVSKGANGSSEGAPDVYGALVTRAFTVPSGTLMPYPNGDKWTPGVTIRNTNFTATLVPAEQTETTTNGYAEDAEEKESPYYTMSNEWVPLATPQLIIRDGVRSFTTEANVKDKATILSIPVETFDYYVGDEIAADEDGKRWMFIDVYAIAADDYLYIPVHNDPAIEMDPAAAFTAQGYTGTLEQLTQVGRFKLIEELAEKFVRNYTEDLDFPLPSDPVDPEAPVQVWEDTQLGTGEATTVLYLTPYAYGSRNLGSDGTGTGGGGGPPPPPAGGDGDWVPTYVWERVQQADVDADATLVLDTWMLCQRYVWAYERTATAKTRYHEDPELITP